MSPERLLLDCLIHEIERREKLDVIQAAFDRALELARQGIADEAGLVKLLSEMR